MRRAFVRVVAALAAASVVVATAGPARAASDEWKRIPCTSGAIDRAVASPDGLNLTMEWHLDCAASPDVPGARFGHGLYPRKGEAVAPGQWLQIYSLTAPTLFAATAKLPDAPELGICVVTDYDVRVGCVRVERYPSGYVAVEPLPTSDPLVDRPVRFVPFDQGGGGTCGGCW
ncbi:hypothetical protein [Phytohabitans houttuyneae]|uniref:Uncharacterized protein n=1 Tax=Phytohabitans houttuyneae TaxID=1076126 RepID=A0A6V8KQ91_9ACTN|nr:hypothetical protein [Phytohabitans houttuyneae]GFJ84026.1 hypothetical protein Phou_082060 [Phytohabitans houttuyneae]